jgi:integrase
MRPRPESARTRDLHRLRRALHRTVARKAVHDQTLEPFIKARLAAGASATTINRSLEVVRTILNRASRSYRDPDGRPWLEGMPPLITMLPENPRSPYPITWQEQDALFRRLPAHLARMALFAINTGLRESNVCGLQWDWEVAVPEIGRSVFVIPPEAFRTKRPHVVILNDVAWSIIESQRGKHPIWVFPYRGRRIGKNDEDREREPRAVLLRAVPAATRCCPSHSGAVCARQAFPRKIVKCFLGMRIIRWRVITQVPTSVACSSRRISSSIGVERRPCYAWPTVTQDRLQESNGNEEYLVLRAKCMNRNMALGTRGQLVPQGSHSDQEDLVFTAKSLKFGAPGRI